MTQIQTARTNYTRKLLGASVRFGPGASIENISLPSDFSTAKILNLPAESTPRSVSELLDQLGFQVPPPSVCLEPAPLGLRSATVKLRDPGFARSLCEKVLAAQAEGEEHAFGLQTIVYNPKSGPDGTYRAYGRTVVCSWARPRVLARLTFRCISCGEDIRDMFANGRLRVLGSAVDCEPPRPGEQGILRLWVPPWASPEVISAQVPRSCRLASVVFEGEKSTAYETDELRAIEKLLAGSGGLETRLTATAESTRRVVVATALFRDVRSAARAVEALNGSRVPFDPDHELQVKRADSVTCRVPTKIFDSLVWNVSRIDQIASRLVKIETVDLPDNHTILRLTNLFCNGWNVPAAQGNLDALFAGEVVEGAHTEKPLWRPWFNGSAAACRLFRPMEHKHRVAFQTFPSKSEIRIHGAPAQIKEAAGALRQTVTGHAGKTYSVDLDEDALSWIVDDGWKILSRAAGAGAVTLNTLSKPKRLEIKAPKVVFDSVKRRLDKALKSRSQTTMPAQPSTTIAGGCCAVCWTEAENPVLTACGHVYCSDCFENFCRSAAAETTELRCMASTNGACGAPLSLQDLQRNLASFEDLLASSATSYVQSRPHAFRYCPTPDCGHVYRVTPDDRPLLFECDACFNTTCTSCHLCPHPGKPCAEHRSDQLREEAFNRAKGVLGIKDCPACGTPIQKSHGCNRVTCATCKTRICWFCLAGFPSSELCYEHMSRSHGGIFGDDAVYNMNV